MQLRSEICVIGNGVIGKAAALGCAQAGFDVQVVVPAGPPMSAERAHGDSWDVRVYALNQVARKLLSSLKVWDAMDISRIQAVDAMTVRGDGAQSLASALTFDAYAARVEALAWIVEDRNLNLALDTALRFAPNVRLVPGAAARLEASGTHARLELDSGDVLEAQLLVGADGAQSWVRSQCDIDIDYRAYGQQAIVTNFHCARPHRGVAFQWFTSTQGIVALLPLPEQKVSLVWSAPEALAQVILRESAAQLAERVTTISGEQLGSLEPLAPERVKAFPLALLRPRSIISRRTALAGDAAHVIHPLAGQGMNLGFADVATLLRVLSEREAHRDCGDDRVLRRYSRARQEEILLMQVATDGLERLFAADFEPVRLARNLGLNLVDKLPSIKRQLIMRALGSTSQT